MRGPHDVGGRAAGRIDLTEHAMLGWERRIDALMMLLWRGSGGVSFTVDEMRRQIEGLAPQDYRHAGYYERWADALTALLMTDWRRVEVAAGPGVRELGAGPLSDDAVPVKFNAGDRVRVRGAYPPGHVRTPFYCRGRRGTIERLCGYFPNPEERAYGRSGLPAQPLYRVRFSSRDLFADYTENPDDLVEIDLYQHWLEDHDH